MTLIFFKANAKTEVAVVGHINLRVIAQDVMLYGCLETVRNPARSTFIAWFQRRNERSETRNDKNEKDFFFIY